MTRRDATSRFRYRERLIRSAAARSSNVPAFVLSVAAPAGKTGARERERRRVAIARAILRLAGITHRTCGCFRSIDRFIPRCPEGAQFPGVVRGGESERRKGETGPDRIHPKEVA